MSSAQWRPHCLGLHGHWRWIDMIWVSHRCFLDKLWETGFLRYHFVALLWRRNVYRHLWCTSVCKPKCDITDGCRLEFALDSGCVRHSSVVIRECVYRLHAVLFYVGLHPVLNRCQVGRKMTERHLRPINQVSSVTKIRGTHSQACLSNSAPHRYITDIRPIFYRGKIFTTCLEELSPTNFTAWP